MSLCFVFIKSVKNRIDPVPGKVNVKQPKRLSFLGFSENNKKKSGSFTAKENISRGGAFTVLLSFCFAFFTVMFYSVTTHIDLTLNKQFDCVHFFLFFLSGI